MHAGRDAYKATKEASDTPSHIFFYEDPSQAQNRHTAGESELPHTTVTTLPNTDAMYL